MIDSIRKYQKESSKIEPFEKQPVHTNPDKGVDAELAFPEVSPRYQKQEAFDTPIAFIVIISGGEKREKDYFSLFLNHPDKFPQIKVNFYADSKKLDPDGMLKLAKETQERLKSSESSEIPDSYYLVSDVDHFRNDLIRIKPECKRERLNLIISNPCFEVWLYYAEKSDKLEGFTPPDNHLKISSALKKWLNEAIPGGCNPTKAIFKIRNNMEIAKRHYREGADGIPELYSTSMCRLAENMLPYIEEELKAIHNANINRRPKTI